MNGLRCFCKSSWALLRETLVLARQRCLALSLFAGLVLVTTGIIHVWDPAMEAWVRGHQDPRFLEVARQLSYWGELHLAPLLALIVLAVVGFWRRLPVLRWAALAGLCAGSVAGISANIVKVIVGRPRPFTGLADGANWFHLGYDYASLPSGHATHCMAVAGAVVVLAPRSGALMILATLAVGWSRWYLTRHYISDVFAGSCLGLAIGLFFGLAARRILSGKSEYTKNEFNPTIAK